MAVGRLYAPPHCTWKGWEFGGYQASRPFQKKNDENGCQRYFCILANTSEGESLCPRMVMWWCNNATSVDRRLNYVYMSLPVEDVLELAYIHANKIDEPPPRATVKQDIQLDLGLAAVEATPSSSSVGLAAHPRVNTRRAFARAASRDAPP